MITFIISTKNKFNPNEYLTGVINIKDGELIEIGKKLIENEVLEGNEVLIAMSTDGRFEARAICYIKKSDVYLKALRTNQINKILTYANNIFKNIGYNELKQEIAATEEEKQG